MLEPEHGRLDVGTWAYNRLYVGLGGDDVGAWA